MAILEPPNYEMLLGTDFLGRDVLIHTFSAFGHFVLTIVAVFAMACTIGLLCGMLIAKMQMPWSAVVFRSLLRVWLNIPLLLLVILGLMIAGPSVANQVFFMVLFLVPSQAIFYLNVFDEISVSHMVLAKRSVGFSKTFIAKTYIHPLVYKRYLYFSLYRLPEFALLDLALNFIGVGAGANTPTFGQILREGLPFMASAWWVWTPTVLLLVLFVLGTRLLAGFLTHETI